MSMSVTGSVSVGVPVHRRKSYHFHMYKLAPKSCHLKPSLPTRTHAHSTPTSPTIDMPETLLSVLCSERWRWDSFASSEITLNQDGTGEVLAILFFFNAAIADRLGRS